MSVRSTRSAKREAAYDAIDSERAYQDGLWPSHVDQQTPLTPGEELLLLEEYLAAAREVWVGERRPEVKTLNVIRKIAGIAVRCLETHGAPPREGF